MESRDFEAALERVRSFYEAYAAYVGARVVGYPELLERLFTAFLSGGHVLLEGAPGLGKTSLAKAWAAFFGLEFRRVQFTPDLMPLDVIGSNILQDGAEGREFRFYRGPIFANVVLGDEINRATPKTQSAFLEAMEERRITFLGETYPLPDPFFVIATQNPIELEGTYPLPEAQVDRFFMKLRFSPPDFRALKDILRISEQPPEGSPAGREQTGEVLALWAAVSREMAAAEEVKNFIAKLVLATHPDHSPVEEVRKYVLYGASPRCAISLLRAAKAKAALAGRAAVSYDDVGELFEDVSAHRVILNFDAEADGVRKRDILTAARNAVRREFFER